MSSYKKQLENPEFREGFEEETSKLDSAVALMSAREAQGLTQRELAARAGVPQSTIARIERGDNTSMETLSRIAFALGKKLKVQFT
ncbi:helix-turn-helix domain-containing protein [Lacticaseibacillus rhamnosus]|uniref:helix-turn-helix domain-containing protein n=1 Tax=Lacticaseibacillus rhamnosus TaxID=47715 RepID=UPI0008A3C685|nr:helix-turn-helix transcriptional regulator [Lacticaseibacillus rhamnosus]MDK7184256.1 helix-turn-helix transcriptional regulator [Lacticaseibacillus rhamnosus]MDK7241317.1 helix-turn-helix transcriptional regulator [Lacticaseibacillus rhamnosus]MDT8865490.1 helix-turn-helix domain-containing protein [Lacticaseibacillus rhamnosus]OFN08665.1 transcriptional regulator [Lactobacillus sp. HMSC072E07]